MAPGKPLSFRIQHLPSNFTFNELLEALRELCEDGERPALQISGLISPSCYPPGFDQVAILQFSPEPPKFLKAVVADRTGSVEYQNVIGSSTISIDKNFFGLTQMFKPSEDAEVCLDIVAVTGLDGNAYGSWQSRSPVGSMWLRDFLKDDMPHCRVMTYGYNTKLASNRAYTFGDFCDRFLEEIQLARSSLKEKNRPLVLIGHSYGCRIITKSLVKCKLRDGNALFKALLDATRAVVFFGAPHRGMDTRDIEDYLAAEFPESEARLKIVSELETDNNAALQDVKDFIGLVRSFVVISIYERKPSNKLVKSTNTDEPGNSSKITGVWSRSGKEFYPVREDSALLGLPWWLEIPIPSESDHSNMAKFDHKDATYRILLGHLERIGYGTKPGFLLSEFLYLSPGRPKSGGQRENASSPNEFWLEHIERSSEKMQSSMLAIAMALCSTLQLQTSAVMMDIQILQEVELALAKARNYIILAESTGNEEKVSGSPHYAYDFGNAMAAYGEALGQLIDGLCEAKKIMDLHTREGQRAGESQISPILHDKILQSKLVIDQTNTSMAKIVELGTQCLYNCPVAIGQPQTSDRIEILARMSVARKDLHPVAEGNSFLKEPKTENLWVSYDSLYFQSQTSEAMNLNRVDQSWLRDVVMSFTRPVASNLQLKPRRYAVLKIGDHLERVMVEFRPYPKDEARDEYNRRRWQVEQLALMLKAASGNNTTAAFPCVPLLYLSEMTCSSTPCFLFVYSLNGIYGLDELINLFKKERIMPPIKDRLGLATSLARVVASLHLSGIVHGRINLENLYIRFLPSENDPHEFSPEVRKLEGGVLLLAGFETSRQFAEQSDKIDVEDPDLRVYLHEDRLHAGGRKSYQYPAHDVFSLGIVMMELGLWRQFKGYSGYKKASTELERRKFVISLRRLFKGDAGIGQNMGTMYEAVISYCLGKSTNSDLDDVGYVDGPLGSPNALHAAEMLTKLSVLSQGTTS